MDTLEKVVLELQKNYSCLNERTTHEGRSRFSQYNNANKFYERLLSGEITSEVDGPFRIIEVEGSAKGNSARIYFKPSITSLCKKVRKCICPLNSNNMFAFFDLRAAEFAMNAIFAQEFDAVNAYHRGEDIYMFYKDIFPSGTERKVIKKILIANMYNKSAYSTAIDLGCSETQAQRLLDKVAESLPRMTMLKRKIISYDLRHNGYFAPNGFDQDDLIKVASFNQNEFSPDFALSCYTQSALGFFMQSATLNLIPKSTGTILSVFDSMCVEISPSNLERYKLWVSNTMSPLIPDNLTIGKTFFDAAYPSLV